MADRVEHRISQQHSLPNSPLLRKRKKIRRRSRPEVYDQSAPVPASPSLTSLSCSSSDSECESNREEEEDPLPDKDGQSVTVKQALEGLFYNKAVQLVHHHELIIVKRYSHGKTFGQRLAYVLYKHPKTRLIAHFGALLLNIISCILYVAEAIYIDRLLKSADEEEFILGCFNQTWVNITEPSYLNLLIIPKDYTLWSLQLFLALICLIGAFTVIYVHQEPYGSVPVLRHVFRYMTHSIVICVLIGLAFFVTLLMPQCLHILWIPTFLFCWPARHNFMYIVQQKSEVSFFRSFHGFRTTAISLATFLLCFMFSCLCLIHHFERLGKKISLFDTYWFVVVTFSTVGYGDISPAHWTGKVIITIFIIAALMYLPPKVDKLWRSFTLHRKHYKQYNKANITKHVVLAAVDLKPLVLRDFLSELYSDPGQMDTQVVVLIKEEPADYIKAILLHPIWSQRVAILRGTALRPSDLARVKLRTADACFLHSSRTGRAADADQHTIMSAWTVKNYAPKTRLFVHVRQPESKFQLNIADEVICDGELTSAVLALNSVCPGLLTLSALLVHTFTYEGRRFNIPEYKRYEECSPVEIYHVKLGESRYFHRFAGKNFLFTSVVAYRKFHVLLLGICPSGGTDILFNPGINHIMDRNDECYYISDTHEHNSDHQIIPASTFQSSLWRTSATLGLLAMYISGIDPDQMFHQTQEYEERDSDNKGGFPRSASNDRLKKLSSPDSIPEIQVEGVASGLSLTEEVGLPSIGEEEEVLDEQLAVEVTNWQHDVQHGLQLLKYHGEGELPERKPCVKLSVKSHFEGHHSPRSHSLPVAATTCTVMEPHPLAHPLPSLGVIPEDEPDVIVIGEEEPHLLSHLQRVGDKQQHSSGGGGGKHRVHSQPALFHFGFNKRQSESKHDDHLLKAKKHSLKLHDNTSMKSYVSSNASVKSDMSNHSIDDVVSLEVEDLSDIEELEDLEEGRQHETEGGFISEAETESIGTPSVIGSPLHHHHHHHHHHHNNNDVFNVEYNEDVPPIPYCGCEPLKCHLMKNARTYEDIIIDRSFIGEDITRQWYHHAIIVYSDVVSDGLFHFITPLRAAYLPPSSLKPIVFLLGNMPERHFISTISQLPMIYFMVGSISSTSDLLRAGIMVAESLVVFSSNKMRQSDEGEHLADAEHITAIEKIARLFPHVKISCDIKYRFNIRFIRTTPFEDLCMQRLRHMARKVDHLTYLFLPQFASSKAFSSSMLDTLLYQSYQKPYIIKLFRQLLGCTQVKGSGFLWKVPVNNELAKLHTYVRVFQRLVASFSFTSMALYRTANVDHNIDPQYVKGYCEEELEKLRLFLISELHSLGIKRNVEPLKRPSTQQFLYVNPPPDFPVIEGDIILGIRPPLSNKPPPPSDDVKTEPFSPPPASQISELVRAYSASAFYGGGSPIPTAMPLGPGGVVLQDTRLHFGLMRKFSFTGSLPQQHQTNTGSCSADSCDM
ncbi:PREDICTED: potassium channel subfamily T member 2-like [Amphimedon queenslandica]|uniref:RCK N-terminal domain-containing protein n=1 Tax=Amphimedon queenslandica TaxID=400682 RepID=A0A1X7URK1_AMPQE|nr:PREDICTED: potassium channel subfamily T member 2-like [Amphimedon queenslandica]|eukprot:XP_019852945.1 PREDICTED: potassium channel subfamily T member 2-like [Amphimedon queenslandica]